MTTTKSGQTWYAFCDEIGKFDYFDTNLKPRYDVGLGIILATEEKWPAIFEEVIPGNDLNVKKQLSRPIQNLNESVTAEEPDSKFHIKNIGKDRSKFLYGKLSNLVQTNSPLKKEIGQVFKWLAEHPDILKIGIADKVRIIEKETGGETNDQQKALGRIMGYIAAYIAPFLPPEDSVKFIIPRRSEPNDSKIQKKIPHNQKHNKTKNNKSRLIADVRTVMNGFNDTYVSQLQKLNSYNSEIKHANCEIYPHESHPFSNDNKAIESLDALADCCAALFSGINSRDKRIAIKPEPSSWKNVLHIQLPRS